MEPHSRGPALHEAERNQYFRRRLVEEFGMDSLRRHNEDFTLRAAAAPARGPRRWEKEAFSTHGSPGAGSVVSIQPLRQARCVGDLLDVHACYSGGGVELGVAGVLWPGG